MKRGTHPYPGNRGGLRIEQTEPARIHKGLIIRALRAHPDCLAMAFPNGEYRTAAEAIAALEAHPGTWIIDGKLTTEPQS